VTKTTTISVPCNSTVNGYGGAASQTMTCQHLSNTGVNLMIAVVIAALVMLIGAAIVVATKKVKAH